MARGTLTMDWGSLGDLEDDDRICHRMSSVALPDDLSDDDDEFLDSRMSFTSMASTRSLRPFNSFASKASGRSLHQVDSFASAIAKPSPMLASYDMWTSEPGDITERRKRLLQGMGLASNKDMLRIASNKDMLRIASNKDMQRIASSRNVGAVPESGNGYVPAVIADSSLANESKRDEEPRASPFICHPTPVMLLRSRSDGDIYAFSTDIKQREEELIGTESKLRLTKTLSEIVFPVAVDLPFQVKDMDNEKEFVVKEYNELGHWNNLRDLETGKQLTMGQFEKSTGHSPMVEELMRRQNLGRSRRHDDSRKMQHGSYFSKSFRKSKKRGAAMLKNIKGVATSMGGVNKEHDHSPTDDQKSAKMTSQLIKTRQHGKSCKEFTALHMTQDIQAHKGSIWTIKFSWDANFLASAGEDKVVHVWEVQAFDVAPDPATGGASDRPFTELTLHGKKSKSIKKKGNSVPDYVNVPETVFALSEKPVCTFIGHQEDVLDISWSKSLLLLSSSMDKTVRLWDLRTKTCLKIFAHNDYVTCIQFNPVDDNYFMSGSLDAKLRIWSISDRLVVDWVDLDEMITAASYTPDGQGAIIGSHQGVCRFYTIIDCKLEYRHKIQMLTKAQAKKLPGFHSHPQTKKITGFQFSPYNPSEVLITSADSRIRIHNGARLIQKYRGFRNTTSQIAASFSPNGHYVISASEDSQVYIWKVEECGALGGPSIKKRVTVLGYEQFHCKDVSVAIPWPSTINSEPSPFVEIHSKRNSKRHVAVSPPTLGDQDAGSRRQLPPIPRRNNNPVEEEESEGSSSRWLESSSFRQADSWASARFDSGNAMQATALGMVIVTASLDGNIRVYQNFGLPYKVGKH